MWKEKVYTQNEEINELDTVHKVSFTDNFWAIQMRTKSQQIVFAIEVFTKIELLLEEFIKTSWHAPFRYSSTNGNNINQMQTDHQIKTNEWFTFIHCQYRGPAVKDSGNCFRLEQSFSIQTIQWLDFICISCSLA